MMMDLLIYSMAWTAGKSSWTGTVIGPVGVVPSYERMHARREHLPMLENAGWHLTWFGGEEAVVAKAKMFAHGEIGADIPRLRSQYHERLWPGEGSALWEHDGDAPRWVEEGKAPKEWSQE